MSRLYDLSASVVRGLYDLRIHAPALLDSEVEFPEGRRFAAQWPALHAEAGGIMRRLQRIPRFHELMESQTDISANDGRDWRMFVVKAYGVPIAPNLAACPVLATLLDRTPQVLSACLSFVAPGKHIPVHRGPLRGVLRFHLGLIVPPDADGKPGTVLWVDGVPHRMVRATPSSGTTPIRTNCTTLRTGSEWRCYSTSGARACLPTCNG